MPKGKKADGTPSSTGRPKKVIDIIEQIRQEKNEEQVI